MFEIVLNLGIIFGFAVIVRKRFDQKSRNLKNSVRFLTQGVVISPKIDIGIPTDYLPKIAWW